MGREGAAGAPKTPRRSKPHREPREREKLSDIYDSNQNKPKYVAISQNPYQLWSQFEFSKLKSHFILVLIQFGGQKRSFMGEALSTKLNYFA